MSDNTPTVREPCEHGHYLMHRLEKMPGSAGPTMSCPGGREIVLEWLEECCTRCGADCDDHATGVWVEVTDEQ